MNALLRPLHLLSLGLAATLLASPASAPATASVAAPLVALDDDDDDEADLERCMEALKVNLKSVASSLDRDDGEVDTLEALSAMQVWALKGKTLSPPNLSTVPAARQDAHRKAFRANMATLLRDLAQMEIDILEGRKADAQQAVAANLLELRERSHEQFQNH